MIPKDYITNFIIKILDKRQNEIIVELFKEFKVYISISVLRRQNLENCRIYFSVLLCKCYVSRKDFLRHNY